MTTAIRMIAGRAPSVMHEALKALQAPDRTRQLRYNRIMQGAMRDPEAHWTADERMALVALVDVQDEDSRNVILSIRLTAEERAALEDASAAANMSVSEYVRRKALEGGRMTRKQITAAEMIYPFEAPQWLVLRHPNADPVTDGELEELNSLGFEVLSTDLLGWGDYNAVIRVTDDLGQHVDYLATLA